MSFGIALLGAGVFAKREHLPAIKACQSFSLKAVYSRSQSSAESFVAVAYEGEANEEVEAYFDSPSTPSKSLEDLLRRDDIVAVIVAVAIDVAPVLIKKALAAGKHVLSEKPIAPDLNTARSLVNYSQQLKDVLWGVGENFRFWNSVHRAAEIIKDLDANLLTFSVIAYSFTDAKNPFYHSDWRQKPTFQGGYLLDGGVHFVAVLRILLAAIGRTIDSASAYTMSLQKNLPPVDTIHAILRTDNGRSGSYISSVGIEAKLGMEFEIVTDKGSIKYLPFQKQILTKLKDQQEKGKWQDKTEPAPLMWGVKEEVAAFAESIFAGRMDSKLSSSEALEDLKVVEAMLKSAEAEGQPIYLARDTF